MYAEREDDKVESDADGERIKRTANNSNRLIYSYKIQP